MTKITVKPDTLSSSDLPSATLHVLGGFSLRDNNDQLIELKARKSRQLLAYLAIPSGIVRSRDQLATLLWSDRQEEQARGSLRTALSGIRRAIGDDALIVEQDTVKLRSGYLESDYDRLKRLSTDDTKISKLEGFYAGEFLAGQEHDSELYMEWLRGLRSECVDLALSVLERNADRLANEGDNKSAIDLMRGSLSLEPLKELTHRTIMKLYVANGEKAMALAQFRTCKEVLLHELGADPDPKTQKLADSIAQRDVSGSPTLKGQFLDNLESTNSNTKFNINTALIPVENEIPSIAVLPFVNMSGDAEQNYFVDGITEDIITDLSMASSLLVVARNSSFTFKNQSYNLQDVAHELSVNYLVEGSVRKSGGRVRITAQLIDGTTGNNIWAKRYDRELTDIFELQDEITNKIVTALKIALGSSDHADAKSNRTRNLEAYDLYLQGRRQQYMSSKENLISAKKLFEQAISLDPNYVRAYCGVSDCSATLHQYHNQEPRLLEEMDDKSKIALKLGADMAEAHASRGLALFVLEKYDEGDKAFSNAVQLDPNLYEAHYHWGRCCIALGRSEEAAEHFYDALAISPLDHKAPQMLSRTLADLGREDEELRVVQISLKNALRQQKLEPDNLSTYISAALGYLRSGNLDGAMKQMSLAESLASGDNHLIYNLACLYSLMGENIKALDCLEKSARSGLSLRLWMENDSDLAPLREHPRFIALLNAMV